MAALKKGVALALIAWSSLSCRTSDGSATLSRPTISAEQAEVFSDFPGEFSGALQVPFGCNVLWQYPVPGSLRHCGNGVKRCAGTGPNETSGASNAFPWADVFRSFRPAGRGSMSEFTQSEAEGAATI